MAGNHVLLETISLTQSAASVVFNNIPQTGYTDLKIVASIRLTDNIDYGFIKFNNTSTNFSSRRLVGDGSLTSSGTRSDNLIFGFTPSGNTANTFSNWELYIPNYLSGNYKSFSIDHAIENNSTSGVITLLAGLWSNVSAINEISLNPNSGSFVANSTFSLYGVAATGTTPATAPKATGGNIVANDGTYWYHAFLSSGNFVPQTPLTCDALVVAGGGGGGSNYGSGGGAGGLLTFTSQAFSTTQAVVIGAGGASATSPGRGASGSNTTLGSLTATIGGGGGGGNASGQYNGGNGGSGGGAGGNGASNAIGGSGTAGQGNAGASQTGQGASSGGGGAGAAGSGVNAGIGATSSLINAMGVATTTGELSSGNYYFAGGGVGYSAGTRGLGGGGTSASSGIRNTGGGSGGDCLAGNSGGSGIVIIRYPMA